jgi:hypothetical protein
VHDACDRRLIGKYRARGYDTLAVAMSYDPPAYANFVETRYRSRSRSTAPCQARSFGDVKLTPTGADQQGIIASAMSVSLTSRHCTRTREAVAKPERDALAGRAARVGPAPSDQNGSADNEAGGDPNRKWALTTDSNPVDASGVR